MGGVQTVVAQRLELSLLVSSDAGGGVIKKLLAEKKFPEERIVELYVRTLTRMPTKAEVDQLVNVLNTAPNAEQGLLDIYWALLNSREFLFNH